MGLAYAYPQCDTMDFEAMHKWALKQFMRTVAHGRHVGAHLSQRHVGQFLFTPAPPPAVPVQPRHCHCGQQPACTHARHVHADMPGLVEQEDGLYTTLRQFDRSTDTVQVDKADASFRHALAVFVGDCNGCSHRDAELPELVYQAKTMQLSWHDSDGNLSVCWKHYEKNTGTGICPAYAHAYAWSMPHPCNAFHHTIDAVHSVTPLILHSITPLVMV